MDFVRGGFGMRKFSRYEKILLTIFVLTLPLVNPWVRGDGVGYYAFARSLLVQRNLDFTKDWEEANSSFRLLRTDEQGNVLPDQYTPTGSTCVQFACGPNTRRIAPRKKPSGRATRRD